MTYTDGDLLDALREFAAEHGRPPTAPKANATGGFPGADTFVRRFDGWNAALAEAGLETRDRGQSEADRRDGLNGASFADYWRCSGCGEAYVRTDTLERHVEQQLTTDEDDA